MKKQAGIIILSCILSFTAGFFLCWSNFMLHSQEKTESLPIQETVRIKDDVVEWFDGVRWNPVDSVNELVKKDSSKLSEEKKEELMEMIREENAADRQEALDSLKKENNEPTVKKKEVKKSTPSKVVTPSNEGNTTPSYQPSQAETPSTPSQEQPTPTPQPTPQPEPDSGDGEDLEWSNDYL